VERDTQVTSVLARNPLASRDGDGKWPPVFSKAIESWAATFRLALLLIVMAISGWGGWLLVATLLDR
jgi:hypothetical protein